MGELNKLNRLIGLNELERAAASKKLSVTGRDCAGFEHEGK